MNVLYYAPFNSRGSYGEISRRYLESLLTDKDISLRVLPYPAGDNKIYAGRSELASIEKLVIKNEKDFRSYIESEFTLLWQLPVLHLMYERRIQGGVWDLFARSLERAKQNINVSIFDYSGGITKMAGGLLRQYNTRKMIVPARVSTDDDEVAAKYGADLSVIQPRYKTDVTPIPMKELDKNLSDKFVVLMCGSWQEKNGFDYGITAYLSEFQHQRDVALVVKTHSTDASREDIAESLKLMRTRVRLGDFGEMPTADVYLVTDHVSDGNMAWLYDRCDTMLHTPLVDGACIAQFEAGLRGKPIILSQVQNHSGILTGVNMVCRSAMDTPYGYADCSPDMVWRIPNVKEIRSSLREMYTYWDKKRNLGELGKETQIRFQNIMPTHEQVASAIKKVIEL